MDSATHCISYSSRLGFEIEIEGERIRSEEIGAVWVRKPFFIMLGDYASMNSSMAFDLEFRRDQKLTMLLSLLQDLEKRKVFMINAFSSIKSGGMKIGQLEEAKNLGLNIPDTIYTEKKKELLKFLSGHGGKSIIKNIGNYTVGARHGIRVFLTQEIDYGFVKKNFKRERKNNYPVFLQEKIECKREIRVTIIGKQLFAVQIEPKEYLNTTLDIKSQDIMQLKHERINLPENIAQNCFALCKELGLQFGAIDLGLTANNDFVFFEINPGGQYLWLEHKTGVPLSEAMADLLMYPDRYRLS